MAGDVGVGGTGNEGELEDGDAWGVGVFRLFEDHAVFDEELEESGFESVLCGLAAGVAVAESENGSFGELVEFSFKKSHCGGIKGADVEGELIMRWRCVDGQVGAGKTRDGFACLFDYAMLPYGVDEGSVGEPALVGEQGSGEISTQFAIIA